MKSDPMVPPAIVRADCDLKACARDVQRFCRSLMDQGDFTILACLQQNRTKLTSGCLQVLTNHGQ